MVREIVISSYDPEWPAMFDAEKARIVAAIGATLVAVEHIGSTSVPGLAAKPIIDMMAAIRSLDDSPLLVEPLSRLGYRYFPELEGDTPYRRYFRRGSDELHTHHLHVVERGSRFWERHLLFRDHLRAHPDVARAYEALKHGLAAQHVRDVASYTTAKTDFIQSVEALERSERLSVARLNTERDCRETG